MLAQAGARKVWVFAMEVAMCLVFLLQWAFTFPNGPDGSPSDRERNISKDFPFVTNGALGGVALGRLTEIHHPHGRVYGMESSFPEVAAELGIQLRIYLRAYAASV
jgi:hypothetical protein